MGFHGEQTAFIKTALSDLQGAWAVLRESVVEAAGFRNGNRVLVQIDEGMSWEVVRDLNRMPPIILVIRNLCLSGEAPKDVLDNIDYVGEMLEEVVEGLAKGECH
jgi:hypothetical protein